MSDFFLNRFRERLQLQPHLPLSLFFSVNLSRQPLRGRKDRESEGNSELYTGGLSTRVAGRPLSLSINPS